MRRIDSCINQLNAQGPASTCNESEEEGEEEEELAEFGRKLVQNVLVHVEALPRHLVDNVQSHFSTELSESRIDNFQSHVSTCQLRQQWKLLENVLRARRDSPVAPTPQLSESLVNLDT